MDTHMLVSFYLLHMRLHPAEGFLHVCIHYSQHTAPPCTHGIEFIFKTMHIMQAVVCLCVLSVNVEVYRIIKCGLVLHK